MSNLTSILNNFDNGIINTKDFIQEVRNYEEGHFGLNFSLNDLVDISEAKGIALSLGEAKEIANVIERQCNAEDGISWITLHNHIEIFKADKAKALGLSKLAKAFVLVCKDSLAVSFEKATSLTRVSDDLEKALSEGVKPENAVCNALRALTPAGVEKVSDFTNSKLQKLMT